MRTSLRKRFAIGIAAGALLLSLSVGFTNDASAGWLPGDVYQTSISWCLRC